MVVILLAGWMALFFLNPAAQAKEELPLAILFDRGNAEQSVAALGDRLLAKDDTYENYRVLTFEPHEIALEDEQSREMLKWAERGMTSDRMMRRARHLFVVKQMKAIYESQIHYFHQFSEGYAPDLVTLIRQEYLADGFENFRKQEYDFRITETSVEFKKDPTFLAIASPSETIRPDFYFSVDHLGLVRFTEIPDRLKQAPVWDYTDHGSGPPSRSLGIEED